MTVKNVLVALGLCCLPIPPALAQGLPAAAHAITVRSMLLQADNVIRSVMAVLVLASVATLSIGLYKAFELVARRRTVAQTLRQLAAAPGLSEARLLADTAAAAMAQLAVAELERYPAARRTLHADGIKERVAALIQRVQAGRQRQLSRGVSILGSIGAAAPFVGLFGTVWGIMNSFVGIAQAQTSNLAVVAPGIAEALLTTAFGLVAAIPAVLVYNAVVRASTGYRVKLDDAATQVMCLLSRELDYDGPREESLRKPVGVVHGV